MGHVGESWSGGHGTGVPRPGVPHVFHVGTHVIELVGVLCCFV